MAASWAPTLGEKEPPLSSRRVSILVPSWNGRELLAEALPSFADQRASGRETEIVVFDNGSTDGSEAFVRQRFPAVRVTRSEENLGFAAACNRLAEQASGDQLLFVNNDARAEPGWVEAMCDALDSARSDVSAVAGRIVDWEGERLDFGRGVLTFDGHALAVDQRRALATCRVPASGEELPFGCGGNLLVRRDAFLRRGGFDPRFFAYFEDVDFGWRTWAAGERIVACADGIVRHRLSASSSRLGNRRRGMLFERNALWTVVKNVEESLRSALLPVVLLTFLSRLEATIGEELPFGVPGAPSGRPTPEPQRERLREKLARHGPVGLARRGTGRVLRELAQLAAPRQAPVQLAGDRSTAHLAALAALFADLDELETRRRATQAERRRGDREIFERFPLWIVPTYPGDEALFDSALFRGWWPDELPAERATLEQVLELPEDG